MIINGVINLKIHFNWFINSSISPRIIKYINVEVVIKKVPHIIIACLILTVNNY